MMLNNNSEAITEDFYLKNEIKTCDLAEPVDEKHNLNGEHWADFLVVAESDVEDEPQTVTNYKKKEKEWYLCSLCNYQSQVFDLFIKHMNRKHTLTEAGYYFCGFCGFVSNENNSMEKHLQNHVPVKQVVNNSWKQKFWDDLYSEPYAEWFQIIKKKKTKRRKRCKTAQ